VLKWVGCILKIAGQLGVGSFLSTACQPNPTVSTPRIAHRRSRLPVDRMLCWNICMHVKSTHPSRDGFKHKRGSERMTVNTK
jgi:hypothetical protein